ncbi:MAG: AMP-dependent synthetase and ligase [Deltaproteobacteria bacterium]|nr:AMP-dependent synthetase and ligase [Deltaproteobacteria bacterium]
MENILPPANPRANLEDYGEACESFRWEDVESEFSWSHTGKINIAHEAIDRHAEDPVRGQRYCLNFEAESRREKITYDQMRRLSNKFANVLRKCGVRKRDRVFFFLPRCPEYYIGVVGCAKVGAIFGPLFEALMQETLRERLGDSEASVLVTTPKLATRVPFTGLPKLRHIIFVGAGNITLKANESSWEEEMVRAPDQCDIEWVDLEDPLYLIYAYSSAGQPKGVVHVHNDMIGHLMTARWVLDLKAGDVLWTTADPGWVTGTV